MSPTDVGTLLFGHDAACRGSCVSYVAFYVNIIDEAVCVYIGVVNRYVVDLDFSLCQCAVRIRRYQRLDAWTDRLAYVLRSAERTLA